VVAIYSRDMDKGLISLISIVDAYTKKHEKEALSSYVVFFTDKNDSQRAKLTSIAKDKNLTIPLTIGNDKTSEAKAFKFDPKVKYAIIVYKDRSVKANFSLNAIDLETVTKIIDSAEKML
jgi:histidyl-tRNA synthetase